MQYLKDNQKNKIYLCVNYPFSNYEHVYYNNSGSETAFTEEGNAVYSAEQANIKKNIYNFVMKFNPSGDAASINNISAVDLTKGSLRLPIAYKQGINFNYMVIAPNDNADYDKTKIYYYAFIDGIEWSSNLESAVIHFRIDTWNTNIHRVNFFESYVEREHVNNDTYGLHTLDEGLTPTEFKVVGATRKEITEMVPLIAVGSTNHIFRNAPASVADRNEEHALWSSDNFGYNPILLGSSTTETNIQSISNIVGYLTEANSADAILGIYLLPAEVVSINRDTYIVKDLSPEAAGLLDNYETCKLWNTRSHHETVNISKGSSPYGLNLKNNKSLIFPYYFLNVSNQLGNELTLKFENSNNHDQISLKMAFDENINGSIYLYATNYNGIPDNLDHSIQTVVYPTIPFIIDSYDSYISANRHTIANSKNIIENDYNFQKTQTEAQYAVSRAITSANDLYSGVKNLVGSGGASLGGTAANLISNMVGSEISHQASMYNINASETLAQAANSYTAEKSRNTIKASLADAANLPDKYCGRYIPNLLMTENHLGFIFKKMAARPEELKAIDNYFTRYGYKVNTFEVPNLRYRSKFDYKKIIDVNFTAEAPTGDINNLKAIFNNGVTIWHTDVLAEIFDYTLNNSIL